jgi:hypothetical protein
MNRDIFRILFVSCAALCVCSCDPPKEQPKFEPNYEKARQRETKRVELRMTLEKAVSAENVLASKIRAVVRAELAVDQAEYQLRRQVGAGEAAFQLEKLREAKAEEEAAEDEYHRGIAELRLGLPDSVAKWEAWRAELMRGASAYRSALISGGYTQAKPAEERLSEMMYDEPEPTSPEVIEAEEKRIRRLKDP